MKDQPTLGAASFVCGGMTACALLVGAACGSNAVGGSGIAASGDGSATGDGNGATDGGPGSGNGGGPQGRAGDGAAPADSGTVARSGDASSTAGDAAQPTDSGHSSGGADASDGSGDGGGDPPCGPSNPWVVSLPVIGASTFDVTKYGAVGDGTTDNTTMVQAALDAAKAAGGGLVSVPNGTYLSGPIVVSSGTQLDLAAGATLKMLPMASWPGTTAFITASGAHDIALTGSGTIEGQGQAWWNALTATPTLARPQEVVFNNSQRVLIRGIRLQNPPEEHIWVKGDTDVTITGITIETLAVSGQHAPNNTDGVDVSGNGVFFCGNSVACGDDNIAMGGTNIYVGYSNFGVGHGCSIGSITQNGVIGLTVEHMNFRGTTSGIRMKSARGRGGLVTNLSYSNITMTNVENPIFITSYYPTLPTDPTTDPAQAVTATTPQWQNITIQNMTATGSSMAGILWGLPEAKISNVTFDDVRISASKEMEIFHATAISFINGSTVTVTTPPAVVVNDATVTGLATQAF